MPKQRKEELERRKEIEATDRIVKNVDRTAKIVDSPDKVTNRKAEATNRVIDTTVEYHDVLTHTFYVAPLIIGGATIFISRLLLCAKAKRQHKISLYSLSSEIFL